MESARTSSRTSSRRLSGFIRRSYKASTPTEGALIWVDATLTSADVEKRLKKLVRKKKHREVHTLFVFSNAMSYIPDTIAQFELLEDLRISSNLVTEIPDWIADLTRLKTLFLWLGAATSMPARISSLTQLENIDLKGNALPAEFRLLLNDKESVQKLLAKMAAHFGGSGVNHCSSILQDVANTKQNSGGAVPSVDVKVLMRNATYIGRGECGQVSAVSFFGTDAVIKEFHMGSENVYSTLQAEMEVLAQLKHPRVIQLLGYSASPPAIVMERAFYGGLDRLLRTAKGKLPFSCQVDLMQQIAAGMVYLHANNIVHRDLKSPNVLLDKAMHVKLADFGLARVRDVTCLRTVTAGTPSHMAPETFNGTYSKKSDVYSFAMTCWEIATQEWPFGELNGLLALIKTVEKGNRPVLDSIESQEMKKLIVACWGGNAKKRPEFTDIQPKLESLKALHPSCVNQWRALEDMLGK